MDPEALRLKQAYILEHYRKVALMNQLSGTSSMQDAFIREAETDFIIEQVQLTLEQLALTDKARVLDLGCGNGYLLSRLRERFPMLDLVGLEFSPDLFALAQSRNLSRCTIVQGDMRDGGPLEGLFDIIITERALINLLTMADQAKSLRTIVRHLRPLCGRYIMVESFKESLGKLNRARKEMSLEEKPASEHNLYLEERVIERSVSFGLHEVAACRDRHWLSTYFYLTRVFHKVCKPEISPNRHTEFVRFFAEALPPGLGQYSPIQFRLFRFDPSKVVSFARNVPAETGD